MLRTSKNINDFFNKLKYRTAEVDTCLKSIEADKYLKFTGSYPIPKEKKKKKRKKIFGIRLPF